LPDQFRVCQDRAMRCVAGVGLLVLVGCNRIYGIPETQPWDALPPSHYAALTWQLATTTADGAPDTRLQYPPFTGAMVPQVRIALIDQPLAPATYASDGHISLPQTFFDGSTQDAPPLPWRLEYQLPATVGATVPHEVQWKPDDKGGHVVVPLAGRPVLDTAPTGGGYHVMPSPTGSYTAPRVLTTGLWTEGLAVASGNAIDYNFDVAVVTPLSGGFGAPDPTKGDRAYALDFMPDLMKDPAGYPCLVAIGGAPLASAAIAAGAPSSQIVTWETGRKVVTNKPVTVDFEFIDRLRIRLDKLHGTFNAISSGILYGVAPGTVGDAAFPPLTGNPKAPRSLKPFELPVPVMQTLVQCPYDLSPPPAVLPSKLDQFPVILHAQIIDTRTVGNIFLHSGLETVLTPTVDRFQMTFPAAMATVIKLATPAAAAPLDLAGVADQVAAGAPTAAFTLTFTTEMGVDRPDYYDVLLHKLDGDNLTTERIYTVISPEVRIDPSVLVGGAEYVFEIRSFKGHPMASRGDFTVVQFPYGSAVVFTRTFKTS
jgi:hypothetical protein